MIDPSSSEEDSDEDQHVHQSIGGRGRGGPPQQLAANHGPGHGARYHPVSGVTGPPAGVVGGGPLGGGGGGGGIGSPGPGNFAGGVGSHGRVGAKAGLMATEHDAAMSNQSGLDVPGGGHSARNSLSPSMSAHQEAVNYVGKSNQRPTSPSPSVASEKTEQELQV